MFKTAAVLLSLPALAWARTIEVEVNGLVCAFCAQGIEKTLRRLPATDDVFVSLEHRLVAIATRDGTDISGRGSHQGAHRCRLRREGNHAHAAPDGRSAR